MTNATQPHTPAEHIAIWKKLARLTTNPDTLEYCRQRIAFFRALERAEQTGTLTPPNDACYTEIEAD